jgi:acyl-CoA reductase-like NAD-dependent aldehyde dehydrogenase
MAVLQSMNPSTGELFGEVTASTIQDVEATVAKAHEAQGAWASASLDERCDALRSFVDVCRLRADEICDHVTLEGGRLRKEMPANLEFAFSYWQSYFDTASTSLAPIESARSEIEIHRVHREPWGVMAAIAPWNYPFLNLAWQQGQALLAGNAVVLKTSEENPLFAQLALSLFEQSKVPYGVFNVVYGSGDVGWQLTQSNVDLISFTGSSTTGQKLAISAAERFLPFIGEMGGSSPAIVMPGACIEDAAKIIFNGRFSYAGQFCDAIKRVIAHESVVDELTDRLASMADETIVGDAMDEASEMGPLIAERQVRKIATQVEDSVSAGAKLIAGGSRLDRDGYFYSPTIITNVSLDMRVWREETFGPALPIVAFSDVDQAVQLANDTEYGLTAHVITGDDEQFAEVAPKIRAGAVVQNFGSDALPGSPFGGYKSSGIGRTNGAFGFHEVTQPKVISSQLN